LDIINEKEIKESKIDEGEEDIFWNIFLQIKEN
jgi:hypothetical protein